MKSSYLSVVPCTPELFGVTGSLPAVDSGPMLDTLPFEQRIRTSVVFEIIYFFSYWVVSVTSNRIAEDVVDVALQHAGVRVVHTSLQHEGLRVKVEDVSEVNCVGAYQ